MGNASERVAGARTYALGIIDGISEGVIRSRARVGARVDRSWAGCCCGGCVGFHTYYGNCAANLVRHTLAARLLTVGLKQHSNYLAAITVARNRWTRSIVYRQTTPFQTLPNDQAHSTLLRRVPRPSH